MTATTILPATLDEVLAYRHPGVIRRYAREHHVSPQQAEELFRETLKWLYLCGCATREGFACALTPELGRLDEMWHTFLLFTRPYADFCERYIGFFLHHVPTEDEEAGEGGGRVRARAAQAAVRPGLRRAGRGHAPALVRGGAVCRGDDPQTRADNLNGEGVS
jgi:hypothetical protein